MHKKDTPKHPGILKIIQGILAGAFGVQSSNQATKDFESRSPLPYIIAGVIFTLLFITTIYLIVNVVVKY
jgi:hypothetical protein